MKTSVLIGLFLLISIALVWPAFKGNHLIGLEGDPLGRLYSLSLMKRGIQGNNPLIGAPNGVVLANQRSQFVDWGLDFLLTRVFSDVNTYNIRAFFALFGTFVSLYVLFTVLNISKEGVLFGSLAIGLSSQHLLRIWQHISMGEMLLPILFLVALISWLRKPNLINSFFTGFLAACTLMLYYYFGFIILALTLTMVFIYVIYAIFMETKLIKLREFVRSRPIWLFVSLATFLVSILPSFFYLESSNNKGPLGGFTTRDWSDLSANSGHLWQYFIPSSIHPIWGDLVRRFLWHFNLRVVNAWEDTYYLGVVTTILIVIYFWRYLKSETPQRKKLVLWFGILGVIAYLWSVAPKYNLLFVKIPTPFAIIFKYFPYVRAANRFGIVAMISADVIAALSLDRLIKEVGKNRCKWVLGSILLILVLDFASVIPGDSVNLNRYEKSGLTKKLASLPLSTVVHYPFINSDQARQYEYEVNQRIEGHPMVNGGSSEDFKKLRLTLLDPTSSGAIQTLKRLGVSYVIMHDDIYRQGILSSEFIPYIRRAAPYPKEEGFLDGNIPGEVPEATEIYKDGEARIYQLQ